MGTRLCNVQGCVRTNDIDSVGDYIDGEIPFAELEAVTFAYNTSWEMRTLSDGNGTPFRDAFSAFLSGGGLLLLTVPGLPDSARSSFTGAKRRSGASAF